MKTPKNLTKDIRYLAYLMSKAEKKYRTACSLTVSNKKLLKEYCDEQANKRQKFYNELSFFLDEKPSGNGYWDKIITTPAHKFIMWLRSLLLNFDPDYLLESCLRADEKCYLEYERVLATKKIPANLKQLLYYQMDEVKNTVSWVIQLKRAL